MSQNIVSRLQLQRASCLLFICLLTFASVHGGDTDEPHVDSVDHDGHREARARATAGGESGIAPKTRTRGVQLSRPGGGNSRGGKGDAGVVLDPAQRDGGVAPHLEGHHDTKHGAGGDEALAYEAVSDEGHTSKRLVNGMHIGGLRTHQRDAQRHVVQRQRRALATDPASVTLATADAEALADPQQGFSSTGTGEAAGLPVGQGSQVHAPRVDVERVRATLTDDAQDGPQEAAAPVPHARVPVLTVLVYTVIMAAASGLGALPFLFTQRLSNAWAGLANAVGCGVMLAASFDLLHEGAPYSPTLTIGGMVLGTLFVKLLHQYLGDHDAASFGDLRGADARKVLLIIGVMAAHALGEGTGVGVSFSGRRGWAQGTLVTIAIGFHNIPEGMAVATVMVSRGTPPPRALVWTLLCSLPQAIISVPSYLFVETFQALLPVALGFAAGCMVWIVFAELMPDALEAADHGTVATAATFAAAWLQGLSMLIAQLEQPNGALASPITADVSALLPRLLLLSLPLFLALLGATAAASTVLKATPALLGAATGVLGWMGVSTVGGALVRAWSVTTSERMAAEAAVGALRRHSHQTMGEVLVCALLGAAAATAAWYCLAAALSSSSSQAMGSEVKRSLAAELDDAAELGTACTAMLQLGDTYQHLQQRKGHDLPDRPSVMQHALNGHAAPYSNGRSAGGTAALVTAAHDDGSGGVSTSYGLRSSLSGGGTRHADKAARYSSDGGGAHDRPDLLPGSTVSRQQLAVAAWFGVCVLLLHGTLLGVPVARSMLAQWDSAMLSYLALPILLAGAPLGLAISGLSRALVGPGWLLPGSLAAAVALTILMSTATLLCGTSVGQVGVDAESLVIDGAGWAEVGRTMLGGATVLTVVGHVWPAVAAQVRSRQRAVVGVALGVVVAAFSGLVQWGLCQGTPYCLTTVTGITS